MGAARTRATAATASSRGWGLHHHEAQHLPEMMHLQKLGELIILLGGQLDFTAKMRGGRRKIWTPEYLNIPENARKMLQADIEAERAAISQYEAHIRTIKDCYVNAVLARIIKDEEYHIILLKALMKERK